jgi:hypothetical protein
MHGWLGVGKLAAIAKVLEHPARQALADLSQTLQRPAPLHTKRMHWVSLAQLEAIAETCLVEGRRSYTSHAAVRCPGSVRSSAFQRGLMLKLLVRVPLRQRNVRELRLGEHLYTDQHGHWQLHFQGGDLKVGARGGRVNEYTVNLTDYCPDLLPVLEEFLREYRARLPGATNSTHLFLTQRGLPFSQQSLRVELADTVAMRTGKRFYPHLIRTIWATECLEKTHDYQLAATMLGDTLKVVIATYYNVIEKDQHAKARAFLGTALSPA